MFLLFTNHKSNHESINKIKKIGLIIEKFHLSISSYGEKRSVVSVRAIIIKDRATKMSALLYTTKREMIFTLPVIPKRSFFFVFITMKLPNYPYLTSHFLPYERQFEAFK